MNLGLLTMFLLVVVLFTPFFPFCHTLLLSLLFLFIIIIKMNCLFVYLSYCFLYNKIHSSFFSSSIMNLIVPKHPTFI